MQIMATIGIAAVTSIVVSVICCNISAKVTLNIIDKYVADMVDMAKESIRNAYINAAGSEEESGVER